MDTNIEARSCPWLLAGFVALISLPASAGSPIPEPSIDLGESSFLDGEGGPGVLLEIIGDGYCATRLNDTDDLGCKEARRRCVNEAQANWNGGDGNIFAIWPANGFRKGRGIPEISAATGMVGYLRGLATA